MPTEAAAKIEWIPQDYFAEVDPDSLFPSPGPLELDLGCGEGAFLVARSQQHPERNFLGTERQAGRVETVCRKLAFRGITNVRLLKLESAYVVKHLLKPGCAAIVHLAFPDPWPKRQHHPRRIIQDEFIRSVHRVLAPGGELRLKTDDLPYFQWMEKVLARAGEGFERIDWPEEPDYPITGFERHFLAQGLPIHRARLRKL